MFNKKLTEGCLQEMLSGSHVEGPVLQVLAHKNVTNDGQQRYRFLVSDGLHTYQCCIMMGEALIARIQNAEFDKYTVIKLNHYIISEISGKKIIIMLEPEVIAKGVEVGRRIGNPGPYEPTVAAPAVPRIKPDPDVLAPSLPRSAPQGTPVFKREQPSTPRTPQGSMNTSFSEDRLAQVWPIAQLTPYQNKWAIKGRVTSKSGVRTWSNAKGEGKLFSFAIKDDSGEIRITAFKQECDRYHEMIEVGKVVSISKATLKPANKTFSAGIDHEYELTLNSDSVIILGSDSDHSCPQIQFDFIKIKEIENIDANQMVDVIGVCRDIGEVSTLTSKNTQRELRKRDISLVDESEAEVKLTLWNDEAEKFTAQEGSAIVVKRARVSEFQGKTLTTSNSTMIQVDPNLPAANGLKEWYSRNGGTITVTKLSGDGQGGAGGAGGSLVSLDAINRDSVMTSQNQALVTTSKAVVTQTGKCQIYLACPQGCKKKLIEMNNGFYKCEKCNTDTMHGEPRLLLNFCISDATNSQWVTAFNDEAEKLLGNEAKQLSVMKEQNEDEFNEYIASMNFKPFIFRIRSTIDNFKEEVRLRSALQTANPVNCVEYSKKLIEQIKELAA